MKRWIVYPWPQINEIGISAPSSGHTPRGTSRLFAAHCCFLSQSNTFHPGPSNFHLQISALMTPFWEPHHKCDDSTTKKDTAVCCCILVDCCVALDRLYCTHMTRFGHTSCTVPPVSPYPHFFMSEVDFEVYRVLSCTVPYVWLASMQIFFKPELPTQVTHQSKACIKAS